MEAILQFLGNHWMELLSAVLGVVYMIQQSKTSAWMWATGTVMPLIKLFVDFDSKLYADFGMQLYYIIIAIYGFWVWRRKVKVVADGEEKVKEATPITRMPRRLWRPTIIIFVGFYLALVNLLKMTDSDVVWIDSLNTVLCIIGMWTCARKYIENWWFWITYDVICIPLYLYKELYFWAIMAVVYIVLGVFGWRKWRASLRSE